MNTNTNRCMRLITLSAAFLLLITPYSFAKDTKEQGHLEEMMVTGTRTNERPIDVPVTTEVITREKIEMSGATHVGDLIGKYITGHYHKFSGLLSPVGLRGFQTESHGDDIKGHILILVDGHRTGTGNAAKINTDRIERIEVIKGPASALYGSAALGGVINLITRKGDGDLTATIKGQYGSFDYYKGQLSGGGEINEQWQFHLTASKEAVDDYDDPTYGTVHSTAESKNYIGGNVTYALNPGHSFRLGGSYGDLTGDYPSWEDGTYSSYRTDVNKNYDKSNGYVDLEYNGSYFDGAVDWRGLVYYLWDRNHWKYGDPSPEADQSKYTDKSLGTDQQFSWEISSSNTLVTGFLLEQLEKEAEGVSDGQPAAPYTPGMDYDTQAFFLQDAIDLMDNRVNLLAAVRYDRFKVTTLHPKTGNLPDFKEKEEEYDHLSPKIGVGVKFLDEMLRVRANVGEGFKSPSADQLSADYVNTYGVRLIGNPDLDPETSMTYDIGFDIFHKYYSFKVSYFHTDYEDKIVQSDTTVAGNPAKTWENHGEAEIDGFDVNVEWQIGSTFQWPVGLSLWTNTTFNLTKEDKETGQDLLYISDYEVKSGLDLSYGDFSSQLNYVLVGPQMITNFDNYPYADEEKDRFEFWDLTLRYRFLGNWEASASVLNLFDDRVEWVRGYLMPERNYRVGLSYTF